MFFDVIKDSLIRMDSVFPGLSDSRFISLCVLAAITAFSLILVIYFSIKKRMRPVTGIMTVVFASVVVLLCIFYPDVDMLYAHPSGDPSEKVNDFLNAVSEGNLPGAYGILYGETETGAQCSGEYYELLSENFSYAYNGEMTVRDLRATVPVKIVYADLTEIPARIDTCFASELDLIVQNHPRKDVYKSDDSYMEWVVEEAYDGAVSDALSDVPEKSERDIVIELSYNDDDWYITPSDELLGILGGGACGNPASVSELADKLALFSNNTKSSVLSDLVYIPKLYSIPEDATAGYVPASDKYFELADPLLIDDVVSDYEHVTRGADLVFSPDSSFAAGQKIYYYGDDSIFTIVWKEYCNNCYCNFAEVFISDPSQFKRKLAGDTYGYGAQFYASSLAQQANAVVAMNGDFYKFRSPGLCVYDRTVYRCETSSLDTCFIDSNGNMIFSYAGELKNKEEAQKFVDDNDILFSLAFGPVLIDNGVPKADLRYRIGETMQKYSRSALGQLGEGHYLLMTISHVPPYKECCTLKGAQDIMLQKGCVNAYTLDGGQTAEIIWRYKPINYVDWGVERTVSDIIYFATAVPEDEQ